jgi:hypothetical protein
MALFCSLYVPDNAAARKYNNAKAEEYRPQKLSALYHPEKTMSIEDGA